MRYQGKLSRWNADRGFGFIVPNGGGRSVFAHISEFEKGRQPADGVLLTYELDARGARGPQARRIELVRQAQPNRLPALGALAAPAMALMFFAAIGGAVLAGRLPSALLTVYAGMSLVTWWAYRQDKQAAIKRRWRTREDHLHLLGLLGGWPGALIAQRWLRHKSSKLDFQILFWASVIANCGALAWLAKGRWLA